LPSRPEPRWRWIAPHAIGFDGFRWHTRACCLTDQSFKDFLLSRIIETRGTKPSEAEPEADADWNEHVTLEIGPHPELSDTQQKVIALNYGMRGERTNMQVGRSLRCFALRHLGLNTSPSARPPQDQQIVLLEPPRTT
jgi:predicted DNA-binding transcriptional regulator YafY